ncbi:MAG: DUF4178 domain-containing protein [Bdellovibrio sp.]|nr:DUF4178 domain-containing protein [Bdellovibrio sp.]
MLKPKIFNCPNCGANLQITALGYTTSVACEKCQSVIDTSHPLPQLLEKYEMAMTVTPTLPIGSFGVLKGIRWKIIGFMVRKDVDYPVEWNEYLLFNPYHGFRFLFEMDSHFSLIETLNFNPVPGGGAIPNSFSNEKWGSFKLFNRGRAEVVYVLGEFYWQVKVGEIVDIDDYINPPYMISVEKNDDEVSYSLGEYLNVAEVAEAFKSVPNLSLTTPWKASANAPNPYLSATEIVSIFSVGVAALIFTAIGFAVMKPTTKILDLDLDNSKFASPQGEFVSPSFDIGSGTGNMELKMSSPVANSWLSSDVDFVNEETGQEYKTELGVEYYYGSDSDGGWSEGERNTSDIISSIPAGRYHLEVSAASDMANKSVHLEFYRNGSMALNFILTLLGLSLYPLWVVMRRRSYEVSRWYDSDYSPYHGPGTLSETINNVQSSLESEE